MTPSFHLAQANVARARAPLDDPLMRGFVEQIEYINSVADRAPGFVWRLQTEEGDATGIDLFGDPRVIVNMSVWASLEDLRRYVFESDHRGPLKRRREWFEKMDRAYSVLWWVPAGTLPTTKDLLHRLNLLRGYGPNPSAFTFSHLFDAHGKLVARPDRPTELGV